jgi:hypothetical protein
MNIAQACLKRYESEDFVNEYKSQLLEAFNNNEGDVVNRILELFNVFNCETEKYLTHWSPITRSQAKSIYSFIEENFEDFVSEFRGCYVGYTSLESIEYGEQEEQLSSFDFGAKYLRQVFQKEGFCINSSNKDYAYYIKDGGLHVDLLKGRVKLDEFLITLK